MGYCSLTDLKKYMPANIIEQLTDDDGIGEINEEVVNNAISQAQVTIDGFCRGRYPAEMSDSDVPDMINDICTKLTAYILYQRRLITTLPETIKDGYKYSISTLKQIQSGAISPWPVASNPVVFKSDKTSSDRIFSRTVWDSYFDGIS